MKNSLLISLLVGSILSANAQNYLVQLNSETQDSIHISTVRLGQISTLFAMDLNSTASVATVVGIEFQYIPVNSWRLGATINIHGNKLNHESLSLMETAHQGDLVMLSATILSTGDSIPFHSEFRTYVLSETEDQKSVHLRGVFNNILSTSYLNSLDSIAFESRADLDVTEYQIVLIPADSASMPYVAKLDGNVVKGNQFERLRDCTAGDMVIFDGIHANSSNNGTIIAKPLVYTIE